MQNKTPPPGATAGEGVEFQIKHSDPSISNSTSSHLQFPPGLVGEIAQFIYDASPRPVREISMVGAIGLLAGICGRAFNISGTGLNQYIISVAKTGRGKEAIASCTSKLMKEVKQRVPGAMEFEGPTEIASPQALIKWLARSPCIYSIVGEFGLKLKEMSAAKAPCHVTGIKRLLLDLYHKSGNSSVLGAMAYAKREDNTPVINSPSFTLIGETTPETLFENIDESIIVNGLLSRFSVIEYDGPRVPLSKSHASAVPPDALIVRLAALCAQCASVVSTGKVQNVAVDPDADAIFDRFNEFCDGQINRTDGSMAPRELWNRAHLKALKLAALHAVGCNHLFPRINATQAQSACDDTHEQTKTLIAHFCRSEMGAIEDNENLRRRAVIKAVIAYMDSPFTQLQKYGAREDLHGRKIITQTYLQRCLGDTAAFRKAPGGATRALAATIKNMLEAGELQEIGTREMQEQFATRMRAFCITNPNAFLAPDEY